VKCAAEVDAELVLPGVGDMLAIGAMLFTMPALLTTMSREPN